MPELELSAGTIEYEDTGGPDPVIVLLHGLFMGGSLWRHLVPDLRTDFRCVLPELPMGAHRRPMRAGADLSGRGQARLVAELLDRLDLRDVTLVGCDWGGAQLIEVPDSYTLIPEDQPAACVEAIRQFVRKTSKTDP